MEYGVDEKSHKNLYMCIFFTPSKTKKRKSNPKEYILKNYFYISFFRTSS